MDGQTYYDTWSPVEIMEDEHKDYCGAARQFSAWIDQHSKMFMSKPTAEKIHDAKRLVTDKYFEWTRQVGKYHLRTRPRETGHTCLYDVWHETYEMLEMAELTLKPESKPHDPKTPPLGFYFGRPQRPDKDNE